MIDYRQKHIDEIEAFKRNEKSLVNNELIKLKMAEDSKFIRESNIDLINNYGYEAYEPLLCVKCGEHFSPIIEDACFVWSKDNTHVVGVAHSYCIGVSKTGIHHAHGLDFVLK